MPITNCHVHTFTADHVPDGFAGLPGRLARIPWLRPATLFLLRSLNPFSNRDRYQRYAKVLEISFGRSQEDVFDLVRRRYPADTRFVVQGR